MMLYPENPKDGVYIFKPTGELFIVRYIGLGCLDVWFKPKQKSPCFCHARPLLKDKNLTEWIGYFE